MKIPTDLIWNVIGDVFQRAFTDKQRRPIEALWQNMSDMASDSIQYLDALKKTRSVFSSPVFMPWGTLYTEPSRISRTPNGQIIDQEGDILTIFVQDGPPFGGGYFRYRGRDRQYFSANFTELESEGGIATLVVEDDVETFYMPSSTFSSDRWSQRGTRQPDNVEGLNWSILRDRFYFDTKSEVEQIWDIGVDEWPDDDEFRSVAINSFGDHGPSFEVRVENNQVVYGNQASVLNLDVTISGDTITRSSGSWRQDGFETDHEIIISGTQSDGTYTIQDVNATTLTLNQPLLDEQTTNFSARKNLDTMGSFQGVPEDIEVRLSIKDRYIRTKVWINGQEFVQPERFRVSAGRRAHSLDVFNTDGLVSVTPRTMVAKKGEITNEEKKNGDTFVREHHTFEYNTEHSISEGRGVKVEPWEFSIDANITKDGEYIDVTPDPEWEGYLPEYAMIGEAYCRLTQEGRYQILSDGEPEDSIQPFSCNIEFIDTDHFVSPFAIPEEVFIKEAKRQELNLYDRFAKMVDIPERDDSQKYLETIKGFYYGLQSQPTEQAFRYAINIIAGAPHAPKKGTVNEVGTDYYMINNTRYDMSPHWQDYIVSEGTQVDLLEPLVNVVEVFDFQIDIEEIQNVTDVHKTWSTILLRLKDKVDLTNPKTRDIITLVRKMKNKRTEFVFEFFSDKLIDDVNLSQRIDQTGTGFASGYEDFVFDDGKSVVNNQENRQKQEDEPYDKGKLNFGQALTSDLVRFKPKIDLGKIVRQSVHLNRELSQEEQDQGFTKKVIRFDDSGGISPTEIHRVIDQDENLATYSEADWNLMASFDADAVYTSTQLSSSGTIT